MRRPSKISPPSRRNDAAIVSLDGRSIGAASAKPKPKRAKAGDDGDECEGGDGGEPIDERTAAIERHLADLNGNWGHYDAEFDRKPNDLSQEEIRQRAEMLHDPEVRNGLRWRRIASMKQLEKRLNGKPPPWEPQSFPEDAFYRGRLSADE